MHNFRLETRCRGNFPDIPYPNSNSLPKFPGYTPGDVVDVLSLLKLIDIYIVAAISWLPTLISQLHHPGIFGAPPYFHSLAVMV